MTYKIPIRLSPDQQDLLTQAATRAGLTLTDFIRSSAIKAANGLLGQPTSQPITLTVGDRTWDLITDLEDLDGSPYTDETLVIIMTDGTEVGYQMGTDDQVDIYLYEWAS
jgi:uncharacterized protein (DUF1778 family)